jgi:exopolysaccharide biosynthesis polyprenyl glycosylphosphotransferase
VLLDGEAASECQLVAQIDAEEIATLCPTVSGLVDFVRSNRIHEVIVSPTIGLTPELQIALAELAVNGVAVSTSSEVYEYLCGRVPVPVADPLWVATLPPSPNVYTVLRRFADVLVGATGLLLGLPVLLCISVAISLESPGWPLYRQERVGRHGRRFRIVKLRTMVQHAEPDGLAVWARPGDSRTTRVGSLLRRIRLDEVPQLWNVLLGEMSLIGPRPERPEFVEVLASAVPMYRARHMVAPGITGWAQVSYRYGGSIEDSVRKLEYDLYYVRHRSLLLDAVILLQTVGVVLQRRGI